MKTKKKPKGRGARAEAVQVPDHSNPLQQALAKRLEYIREQRGISAHDAAKQVGISSSRWTYITEFGVMPDHRERERMAAWAFDGVDFTNAPRARPGQKMKKGDGWKRHWVDLPKSSDLRLIRMAKRTGYSMSAIIQLALERFLDNEPIIATFEEAIERAERARVTALVNTDPNVQTLLEGDLELAVKLGAKLVSASKRYGKRPEDRLSEPAVEGEPFDERQDWEVL